MFSSRIARSSGVASRSSTIARTLPSSPRTMRPYGSGSSGSIVSTVTSRARAVCVDQALEQLGVSSGAAASRTSTAPGEAVERSRAPRPRHPCRGLSAAPRRRRRRTPRSSPATRRRRAGRRRASRAASSTQSTTRRPSRSCRCFGTPTSSGCRDRRPSRQLQTSVMGEREMAGAPGFEPGIAGPKPAALPLGYAPSFGGLAVYRRSTEEEGERDRGDHDERDDRHHRQHAEQQRQQSATSSCENAAIQETSRRESSSRAAADATPRRGRSAADGRSPGQPGMTSRRTSTPSTTAIQSAIRIAGRAEPTAASAGAVLDDDRHASTVPSRCCQPGAPERAQPARAATAGCAVVEQAVHRRPGAGHVRPECTERAELDPRAATTRGRSAAARRDRAHGARRERVEDCVAPLLVAVLAVARVERRVDLRGRSLRDVVSGGRAARSSPAAGRAA